MYRILVIDDEQVVREGVSKIIDWDALGFELVGACRDGREGLDKIARLKPDVVITDICMPFVDGLELAGAIADEFPGTKTILLTGYDEFEYAQEAVKLKVHDFLIKPITAAELTEVLRDLSTQLDRERDQRRRLVHLQEQLRATLPVFRERFLHRLVGVAGHIEGADLKHTLQLLELELPGPTYIAMICDIDPSLSQRPTDEHLCSMALQNILSEAADRGPQIVSFSTSAEEAVAILSVGDPTDAVSRALETAEQVADRVRREVGRTITVGIGGVASELHELSRSYDEAGTALEHRFVLGGNQIITISQVRGNSEPASSPREAEPRSRYAQAIKAGIPHETADALREVVRSLRQTTADMDYCHVVMHRVLADTLSGFEAIGVDYRDIPGIGNSPFAKLSTFKTLEDMERWIVEVLDGARGVLIGRQQTQSRLKAIAAEEFIHGHYMEPDLSLRTVCRALAVSKSYLSPVFKAYSGMTLVEYLTRVRMDQAKLLLSSGDRKVYEVAEAVGFRDAHYFSLTFKKQTGRSPTDFREIVREQGRR
jgi:two-component system response regulator YesN